MGFERMKNAIFSASQNLYKPQQSGQGVKSQRDKSIPPMPNRVNPCPQHPFKYLQRLSLLPRYMDPQGVTPHPLKIFNKLGVPNFHL